MDPFILYRVRENGCPAPPIHERIRSVRYEKVQDTFSLTVLIETKAPSMTGRKKSRPRGCQRLRYGSSAAKITMKMKNENDAAVGDDDDKDDSDDDGGFWMV